mmetsp:Transcript_32822/g.88100  ORF Transcript_32822/g.88100 Transcript_32822/m.88100 type:complete len:263 (+) Transcript_32822:495-1283(+)
MSLDRRELELAVVWVHRQKIFSRRCAEHLDNLYQLVCRAVARKDNPPKEKFRCHACCGPDVYDSGVVRRPQDQLRRTVKPRTDVRRVRLALDQPLCRTEVAHLQGVGPTVHEKVVWLDVPVADIHRVHMSKASQDLVTVELDERWRHQLPHLCVVFHHVVDSVGAVLHHDIEVLLRRLVAVHVKRVLELDNVRVSKFLHHLQLAIFITAVLENFLDGDCLPCLHVLRLVNCAESSTANNTFSTEGEPLLGVTSQFFFVSVEP